MQKIPPPTGGEIRPWFRKNSKLFLHITIGEIKKGAAGENFRNTNCFYTKNSAKMQKNGQQKIPPPRWGGQKMYLFWDYRKIPPLGGGFTPSFTHYIKPGLT